MQKIVIFCCLTALAICTASGQWKEAAGPFIVTPVSCTSVLAHGEMILIRGQAGNIYRSVDGGKQWRKLSSLPRMGDCALSAGEDESVDLLGSSGLWRSSDFGATWDLVGPGRKSVTAMAHHGAEFRMISGSFPYRSDDGGKNWSIDTAGLVRTSKPHLTGFLWLDTTLFIGTGNGIFRYERGERRWQPGNNGLPSDRKGVACAITCLARSGPNLYAGTEYYGVFESTDAGTTWFPRDSGLVRNRFTHRHPAVQSLFGRGSTVFAALADGRFFTTMVGATIWEKLLTPPGEYSTIYGMALLNDSLVAATKSGLFLLNEGDSTGRGWRVLLNEYPEEMSVTSLASIGSTIVASGYTKYIDTWQSRVFHSTGGEAGWNLSSIEPELHIPQGTSFNSMIAADSILYGVNAFIYKSDDRGAHFFRLTTKNPLPEVQALCRNNDALIAGCGFQGKAKTVGGGVYRSTNDGRAWKEIGLDGMYISAITSAAGTIIAAAGSPGLQRSTNGGRTWLPSGNGMPDGTIVRSFTTIASTVFAAATTGIYRSDDLGDHWNKIKLRLTSEPLFNAANAVLHAVDTVLFAGTTSGIYCSFDRGGSWDNAGEGLREGYARVHAIANDRRNLYLGTDAGVWDRPLQEFRPRVR